MTIVSPAKAQNKFLFSNLVPRIVSPTAPQAINLRYEFSQHFERQGLAALVANELANDQFVQLCGTLERHLQDWDLQGVPRPLAQTDQDHIFVAWPHEEFCRHSGLSERINTNFCDIFEYTRSLTGNQFLVICALWLKCGGFNSIFICDSVGDEGVDVLGLLDGGELRSLVASVQAKTSSDPIGRGLVLAEYGKYMMLPHTEKYVEYRRALGVDSRVEGVSWSFMVLGNNSFNSGARRVSNRLGILLRSIHQISYSLANNYTKADIKGEVDRLCGPRGDELKPDLTTNFLSKLQI